MDKCIVCLRYPHKTFHVKLDIDVSCEISSWALSSVEILFNEFKPSSVILHCMKKFSSPRQKIGEVGENIASMFLKNKGFHIIERNYTRKCGEIDIIARFEGVIHFIEVKSVSCENFKLVLHDSDTHRPEDQAHVQKLRRLSRTIRTYLDDNKIGEWRFDLICVYLNRVERVARVKMLSDLIF